MQAPCHIQPDQAWWPSAPLIVYATRLPVHSRRWASPTHAPGSTIVTDARRGREGPRPARATNGPWDARQTSGIARATLAGPQGALALELELPPSHNLPTPAGFLLPDPAPAAPAPRGGVLSPFPQCDAVSCQCFGMQSVSAGWVSFLFF